jgi:hypothetical protein
MDNLLYIQLFQIVLVYTYSIILEGMDSNSHAEIEKIVDKRLREMSEDLKMLIKLRSDNNSAMISRIVTSP